MTRTIRRVLPLLTLVLGALSFVAVAAAHGGGHKGHGKQHGNTFHYRTTLTSEDTGTCGQQVWATDTLKRTYAVHRDQSGGYTLTAYDRGTFVTSAAASPGACEQDSKHGTVVTAGIKGHEDELFAIGFTRRKAEYAVGLARSDFDLGELAGLDDDEVRERITALRGLGPCEERRTD